MQSPGVARHERTAGHEARENEQASEPGVCRVPCALLLGEAYVAGRIHLGVLTPRERPLSSLLIRRNSGLRRCENHVALGPCAWAFFSSPRSFVWRPGWSEVDGRS